MMNVVIYAICLWMFDIEIVHRIDPQAQRILKEKQNDDFV